MSLPNRFHWQFALMGLMAVSVAQDPPPPVPTADILPPGTVIQPPVEQGITVEPGIVDDSEEAQTLLTGPLHEAFAQPVEMDPLEYPVIPFQPPAPIDEAPPETRPEGSNVVWIPGYWAFDPDEEDYIWISGVWRDVPPGRRWESGYWADVEGGFVWIPGEWLTVTAESLEYLPQPPASLERGPSSPAPGDNYFWVQGCWIYQDANYIWRPGFWSQHQPNWVWVPQHYNWTPAGYIYTNGYWDYELARRGVLYAPYRFRRRPIGRYRPGVVIDVGRITLHLFVHRRARRYVFGNYYGRNRYLPWHTVNARRTGFSPLYSYYSRKYGRDYGTRLAGWNSWFVRNTPVRPPISLAAQRRLLNRQHRENVSSAIRLGRQLSDIRSGSTLFGRKLVTVSTRQQDTFLRDAERRISALGRQQAAQARRSTQTIGSLKRIDTAIRRVDGLIGKQAGQLRSQTPGAAARSQRQLGSAIEKVESLINQGSAVRTPGQQRQVESAIRRADDLAAALRPGTTPESLAKQRADQRRLDSAVNRVQGLVNSKSAPTTAKQRIEQKRVESAVNRAQSAVNSVRPGAGRAQQRADQRRVESAISRVQSLVGGQRPDGAPAQTAKEKAAARQLESAARRVESIANSQRVSSRPVTAAKQKAEQRKVESAIKRVDSLIGKQPTPAGPGGTARQRAAERKIQSASRSVQSLISSQKSGTRVTPAKQAAQTRKLQSAAKRVESAVSRSAPKTTPKPSAARTTPKASSSALKRLQSAADRVKSAVRQPPRTSTRTKPAAAPRARVAPKASTRAKVQSAASRISSIAGRIKSAAPKKTPVPKTRPTPARKAPAPKRTPKSKRK